MQKEKHEYCESDVTIQREGAMKFRDDFMENTCGIDPFFRTCTLPSACSLEFRTHHLQPNTIGLIPAGGYKRRERHSVIAIKYKVQSFSSFLTFFLFPDG